MDRKYGITDTPKLISLPNLELARANLIATGLEMAEAARFTDGAMSVSYKISVRNDPDTHFLFQIRHIGDMQSIYETIQTISAKTDPEVLSIPAAYDQKWIDHYFSGENILITKFVPAGVMAFRSYPKMSHEQRVRFVQNFARAFNALWNVDLPSDTMIGGVTARREGDVTRLTIGPNRLGICRDLPLCLARASVRKLISAAISKSEDVRVSRSGPIKRGLLRVDAQMEWTEGQ